jgi:hypothetical protein
MLRRRRSVVREPARPVAHLADSDTTVSHGGRLKIFKFVYNALSAACHGAPGARCTSQAPLSETVSAHRAGMQV